VYGQLAYSLSIIISKLMVSLGLALNSGLNRDSAMKFYDEEFPGHGDENRKQLDILQHFRSGAPLLISQNDAQIRFPVSANLGLVPLDQESVLDSIRLQRINLIRHFVEEDDDLGAETHILTARTMHRTGQAMSGIWRWQTFVHCSQRLDLNSLSTQ
jgi:hypothetical protein